MSNADEPAFSSTAHTIEKGKRYTTHHRGITKREYFAAKAMQGLCAGTEWLRLDEDDCQTMANSAVRAADALLAALSAPTTKKKE